MNCNEMGSLLAGSVVAIATDRLNADTLIHSPMRRMDAGRSASGNGDAGSVEITMNVLVLIRTKMVKAQRLDDAQFLMAKAYRGVAYVDAHHDDPRPVHETRELTYRGQHYVH